MAGQDVRVRKAQAWAALNKMDAIWKSKLGRKTKISLFSATVVSVLLYVCETWTLNKQMNRSLDGCYTRMLRKVLNLSWKQHIPNTTLYGDIPPMSHVIRKRRLKFARPATDNIRNNPLLNWSSGNLSTDEEGEVARQKHFWTH